MRDLDSMVARMLWRVAAALVIVLLVSEAYRRIDRGIVYSTWPDQACQHVEPGRFSCDNLPSRFEIVWVSPEWKH